MAILPHKSHSSVRATSIQALTRDEVVLARFNKKQQLLRRFGTLSAIGVTCTLMLTWEATSGNLLNELQNGGPTGCIIIYLVAWFGACLQACVVAEMASMVPLAGGPFNWVAIFSPPWCRKYLSYLAGWLSLISYMALVAGTGYTTGPLAQGLILIKNPDYDPTNWQTTLFYFVALSISLFVNTYLGRVLPQIESLALFLHVLGFLAILITLLYLGDHNSADFVFNTFYNIGDWSSNGLAALVGSVTITNAFCGLDGVDHIAEELHDAPRTIPIAIGSSMVLNGIIGFAMLLALLFTMPTDIAGLLQSQPTYPFIGIYQYAVKSDGGAIVLTAILYVASFFGVVGIVATASRMVWAFAREGGLPGSRYLSRVSTDARLPIWAIVATTVVNVALGLINVGSSVGFGAFISLIVAGYCSAFLLAAGVMLHKRLTTPHDQIPWGPFRMGRWGVPVTVLAMCYSFVATLFSMFPAAVGAPIAQFNYCVFVYGGTLLFSTVFWFLHGKKRYTGPIIEIEL